jgi:hypothetical protein
MVMRDVGALYLQIADERIRGRYCEVKRLRDDDQYQAVRLQIPGLEGKDIAVRWRAVPSAAHHVLFVEREVYVKIAADPVLCSVAFKAYASQELVKVHVRTVMEAWTDLS